RPAATEVLIGDTVPVTLRIRDAAGTPMPDVQLSLSGTLQGSARTSSAGTATAAVTAAQDRAVTVRASALGGSDSARVIFLTSLPTGSTAAKQGVGNMRVFVENSRLRASNTDETKVRVIAFDKFNNPLAGRLVRFTADQGIITATDTTDARGEAMATYRSVPRNTDARITATMVVEDSALAVVTRVTLAGLEVDIRPTLTDALLNRQVPVHVRIIDGAGHPVPDATVNFNVNGNPSTGTTDGEGIFRASVTSGIRGRVFVTAEALGSTDTSQVDFWDVLPTKGSTGEVDGIRAMRIFTSRSQLRADNSDAAQVTVILTNEKNNPAVGELVRFTSNLGIIDQTARVDSTGRATVTLRATPVNGPARVEATAVGRNVSAATEILFSGVTLQIAPDRTELKVGEQAAIEVFLRDASGNAIGGDTVKFSLVGSGASFDNGQDAYAVTLDWKGRALVRVTGSVTGTVKVKASALNMADSLDLRFSNNKLTLSARLDSLTTGGDTTTLTALYVNSSGFPVPGAVISFATNAGSVSPKKDTTDAQGQATTTLTSAPFAGTATVQANAPTVTAQTQVTFTTSAPTKLKLSVSADNISVNGGIATLKAVVQDSQGNMVSGRNINFRILTGPGGGEAITKPVVQAVAGTATSQIQAGSVPSGYRGVMVEASVDSLADTTVLTISGAAHIVTVSRPEDDSIVVPGGGKRDESTFEFFIGAVVQDINGNYVADGTEVRFSAVVTGMALGRRILDRWESTGKAGTKGSVKAIYRIGIQDIPFEDINDNRRLDPGIDLDLDFTPGILRRGDDRNGNGTMDWDPNIHDTWVDLNGNGVCEADVGEDVHIVRDSLDHPVDTVPVDLNQNGRRDTSEILIDHGTKRVCDLPTSGDYPHAFWEARDYLPFMNFSDNHFAVAIEASAVTKNGIAYARLRYPRQFARRLYVTVNAESNGLKDRDGERFILPQIK
ncbi:MAG TPA: Ig-like domain-containing protein, partial [Fibrobacteria bacterium]|nr:Ig-like domain-containing protein [Fibrobacteria bacterium]